MTDKGVSRFDGRNFKNYTVLDGLGDNEVFSGYEDRLGRMWLYTFNGSPCYIYKGRVYNASNDSVLKKIGSYGYVNSMCEDKAGNIYMAYSQGAILKITGAKVIVLNEVYDNDDKTYVVYAMNDTVKVVSAYKLKQYWHNRRILTKSRLHGRSFWQENKLLVINSANVEIWQNDKCILKLKNIFIEPDEVNRLYQDKNGNIFCSTNNGLLIINAKTGNGEKLLQYERISSLTQDVCGNYWVSTLGHGVLLLNRNLEQIKLVNEQIDNYKVCTVQNGQICFTCKDSVYVLNNTLQLEKLNVRYKKEYTPVLLVMPNHFLCACNVSSIYYNLHTGKKCAVPFFAKIMHPYLEHDSNRFVTVGLYHVGIISMEKGYPKIVDQIELPGRVFHIQFSPKGEVYCISNSVLYMYNPWKETLIKIDSLNGEHILNSCLYANKLVLYSNLHTAIAYDIDSPMKRPTVMHTDIIVYNAYNIGNGRLLLYTNEGYLISPNKPNSMADVTDFQRLEYPFRQKDILFLHVYKDNVLCNVNGKLYAFSANILNSILDTPALFLRNIVIDGQEYKGPEITLNNRMNAHVHLGLSTLYFNTGENSFQYRIISEQDTGQWYRQSSGDLDIALNGKGAYIVQYSAITENNVSSALHTLAITLLPPFYYTRSFYFLVIVVFILIIGLIIYYIVKRRKKIFENELHYLQLENKAVNSLMTPHFVFNAISNIQNLINMGSKETANNYLTSLSRLIRQNIENLQFQFISVDKELKLVENYIHLQNLRFSNNIQLEIHNNLEHAEDILIPPLLIHTFVENSVVHGFDPLSKDFFIKIEIDQSISDELIIKITDNGVGLKGPKTGDQSHLMNKTSMGIKFTRKRLQRLSDFYKVDYSLQLNNVKSGGTEVMIILSSRFNTLMVQSEEMR